MIWLALRVADRHNHEQSNEQSNFHSGASWCISSCTYFNWMQCRVESDYPNTPIHIFDSNTSISNSDTSASYCHTDPGHGVRFCG
jgi:hypothetical protein